MNLAQFQETVEQIVHYGSKEIWLTPMLGEIFADASWTDKLQYVDGHSKIERYGFFTNFILPSPKDLETLVKLRKLGSLHISIYGHDRDSFQKITRKGEAQYQRLIVNLEVMTSLLTSTRTDLEIHVSIRSTRGMTINNLPASDIVTALQRLSEISGASIIVSQDYDNWGGTVSDVDVAEIGTPLTDGRFIYMFGACQLLFCPPQISADGDLRACACRDVDGSLTIGNIHDRPLNELHSFSNPAFVKIINDQQAGRFSGNCRTCSLYRSIYDGRVASDDPRWPLLPFSEAQAILSNHGQRYRN